jgi:signal transduction histidine kinase
VNAPQTVGYFEKRVAGLLEITEAINSELHFKSLLKILARKTAEICGADRCSVYLWQDGMLDPVMSQYGSGVPNLELWRAFKVLGALRLDQVKGFKRALEEGHPVVVEDPVHSDLLPREWVDTFHIKSGLIFPLTRDKRFVGVMHLNNCESARAFGPADVELAGAIAGQLALVIDNARLVEETRGRLRDMETLLKVSKVVSSTLDTRELVRRIARTAARALDADSAGMFLVHENGILQPVAGYRIPPPLLGRMRRETLRLETFPRIATMIASRPVLWSDDVPNDARFVHEVFTRVPMQSILIAALKAKDQLVGVMTCAWWSRRRRFAERELKLVEATAGQAVIAIVNARLYSKAEELAANRERVRVAQDLHDRLSQTVFSLGLKLESCLYHLREDAAVRDTLEDVRHDARSIMKQMRSVIDRLSADRSPAEDFSARLRKLIADFEQLSGIAVTHVEEGDLRVVDGRAEEILFKTLQEGLANIVKHAHAAGVVLNVSVLDGVVRFELVDDGVGPPAGKPPDGVGTHGLRQMVERIEGAGGAVQFGAASPSGFAVRGFFPGRRAGCR